MINPHRFTSYRGDYGLPKNKAITRLPIKHLTHDKEITFESQVLKKTDNYALLSPAQQFFVQFVKFAPGKGPDDYVLAYRSVDDKLKKLYGKTRCEMGIHEIITFVTYGRYDLVVLFYAPSIKVYNKFLAVFLNPGNDFGTTETSPAGGVMLHPVGG